MKIVTIKNLRKGFATNSSSTHSIIFKNKKEVLEDLNIFDFNYYERYTKTIASTRKAKLKYILAYIYDDENLVERLLPIFPEIKEYFPLIKKNFIDEDNFEFGGCYRGMLFDRGNQQFSFEHICNIINNDNIAIIGGSDEQDFVYEMGDTHKKIELPYFEPGYISFKNGNYWIYYKDMYKKSMIKFRCTVQDHELIPEHPELIDLKITNKCSNKCSFCYQDSTIQGLHADPSVIMSLVSTLQIPTEFAVGGGNILEHPQLPEIFNIIKKDKHILNITLNNKDIWRITQTQIDAINKYVDGIGISVTCEKELENFFRMVNKFEKKYITCHLIPEIIGYDETVKIMQTLKNVRITNIHFNVLFLGAKFLGRAQNLTLNKFTSQQLKKLFRDYGNNIGVDTSFINHYEEFFSKNYDNIFFTKQEGEFSIYIDAVEGKCYKSSYQLEKAYLINEEQLWDDKQYVTNTFKKIREDNKLPIFTKKHYWE